MLEKKKWISGHKLIKSWDITDTEFLDYVKNGLRPYTKYAKKPVSCPHEHHISWKSSNQIANIINMIQNLESVHERNIPLTVNIIKYKEKHPLGEDGFNFQVTFRHSNFKNNDIPEQLGDLLYVTIIPLLTEKLDDFVDKETKSNADFHEGLCIEGRPGLSAGCSQIYLRTLNDIPTIIKLLELARDELSYDAYRTKQDDIYHQSWKYFVMPEDEVIGQKIIEELQESVFKVDEIKFFEKKYGIYPKDIDHTKQETEKVLNYSFILNGDYWEIRYRDKETKLRALERISYIIHLLDNPGEEFFPNKLISLVKGQKPEIDAEFAKMTSNELNKIGMDFAELSIDGLSREDKEKLENRAYDIWNALQKAKKEGSQSINDAERHWNDVKEYLAKEYGILVSESSKGLKFFLKKRLSKDAEKARQLVSKHINNAINKDIKPHMPRLGEYLKRHITSKGGKFFYEPNSNNPTEWKIQW